MTGFFVQVSLLNIYLLKKKTYRGLWIKLTPSFKAQWVLYTLFYETFLYIHRLHHVTVAIEWLLNSSRGIPGWLPQSLWSSLPLKRHGLSKFESSFACGSYWSNKVERHVKDRHLESQIITALTCHGTRMYVTLYGFCKLKAGWNWARRQFLMKSHTIACLIARQIISGQTLLTCDRRLHTDWMTKKPQNN